MNCKAIVKTGLLGACLAGFAGMSATAIAEEGKNLLKNGDFEAGTLAGWGNWTSDARMRILKEGAHGGQYCCEYAVDSDKGGFTVNRVPLVSNKTYTVSGWVRGDAGVLEVRLFYRDANGKWLAEASAFRATKLANWTHFEKVITATGEIRGVQIGLHVARGTLQADDLRVEEGNHVGEAPNEIPNSDFGYILHENGMPDLWNTGGGYSFNTFRPGVHEGKFYRMAPEESAPVPGARVLFQRDIRFSWWKTGPLAGDTDYVLSIYAKSPDPKAKMELDFGTNKKSFALSNAWQRLVLRTHLKNSVGSGYPRINFGGFPVYLSAPMLHAGGEPLAWKPSPLDANFADLKGGTQTPPKAAPAPTRTPPPAALFAATEFDAYRDEKTVRVRVRDAEGPATAALYAGRGRSPSAPLATALYAGRGRSPSAPLATAAVSNGQAAFDSSILAPGYYEIEVSAANGKSTTHFRKFAAGERFTRINRFKRQIEVDGKPFFPTVFNWSGRGAGSSRLPTAWQIEQLKSHNFNTIMPDLYCSWDRSYTTEYRTQVLKIFSEAGFKFLIWSDAGVDFKSKDRCIDRLVAARQKQIDELAAFKKDILGWYYVDEIAPAWEGWFGVKLEDYARGYRAMKDHDPGRLHFINWNWTGCSAGKPWYAEEGATDLYSLDCYTYSNDLFNYGALTAWERGMELLRERTEAKSLPGIAWLQIYNHMEGTREPMPVEYRNNVCIALINRVTGFMHFIGCPEAKDLWDEMGRDYGFALKFLEMTAQPGAEMLARGKKGTISYALWKDGKGGYALVAANTLYAAQREKVEWWSGGMVEKWSGGKVEKWSGGKVEKWSGGKVELIGGEGEVKIGADGELEIALPSAGSAVWFVR